MKGVERYPKNRSRIRLWLLTTISVREGDAHTSPAQRNPEEDIQMDPKDRADRRHAMTRRALIAGAAGAAGAAFLGGAPLSGAEDKGAAPKGRINQSVSKWCFGKWSLDELCRTAADIGLKGIDLVGPSDWPTIKKYGLVPTMTPGAGTIGNGWNRKENHDRFVEEMKKNIDLASAAGVPNVICMSGERKGLPDDVGIENCVTGLKRVAGYAEEKKVTMCMELLNSKVDHKDYQCDRTAWGVEVVKRVGSPRLKLLYDIYHMQIMEGDVIRTIRQNIAAIGHFHTGGNPGRNEIDETQELNYTAIMKAIADLKFEGYVAHEFMPKGDPRKSLEQAYRICLV
jgi:hydroxypyruvate isomerase